MQNSKKKGLSYSVLMSSLLATALVTACNDSKASPTPAAPEAAQENVSSVKDLVNKSSDINNRNHVCFTMDVNNVKCVLGDTVAYVPQPILPEEKEDTAQKAKDNKSKGKDKPKDAKDAEKEKQEQEVNAQLEANQQALNEARSLVFVAKYCDMEKSIVYSKEGVACTFKPHALYDAGAVAEATQYQMNLISSKEFFAEVAAIPGAEKFTDDAFGEQGGYRIFLKRGADQKSLKIGPDTVARILTKRIDREGNVLGFYQEELNFANLNPQMRILTSGLVAGDHVKLVFDTDLQNEQPLWRTSSLEFGQPYIWEVIVESVGKLPEQKAPEATNKDEQKSK